MNVASYVCPIMVILCLLMAIVLVGIVGGMLLYRIWSLSRYSPKYLIKYAPPDCHGRGVIIRIDDADWPLLIPMHRTQILHQWWTSTSRSELGHKVARLRDDNGKFWKVTIEPPKHQKKC